MKRLFFLDEACRCNQWNAIINFNSHTVASERASNEATGFHLGSIPVHAPWNRVSHKFAHSFRQQSNLDNLADTRIISRTRLSPLRIKILEQPACCAEPETRRYRRGSTQVPWSHSGCPRQRTLSSWTWMEQLMYSFDRRSNWATLPKFNSSKVRHSSNNSSIKKEHEEAAQRVSFMHHKEHSYSYKFDSLCNYNYAFMNARRHEGQEDPVI